MTYCEVLPNRSHTIKVAMDTLDKSTSFRDHGSIMEATLEKVSTPNNNQLVFMLYGS